LAVPIELVFGGWISRQGLGDLKRYSIPVGVSFEYDISGHYESDRGPRIRYTRDEWGLRGSYRSLRDVEMVTVGGSTTDQRFLDDGETWQAVAERELRLLGRPLVIANAGVDGQSTVGHMYTLGNWLPLVPELSPRYVLFYVGINDVLRPRDRGDFDAKLDPSTWRAKSAIWQLVRTVRGSLAARTAKVTHGRMPRFQPSDFTETGLLGSEDQQRLATELTARFVVNLERLRETVRRSGASPIFVTQSAYAWNAGRGPPRGLNHRLEMQQHVLNFADISAPHKAMNLGLLDFCRRTGTTCIDLAGELVLGETDYYDFVHPTPRGAEKVGRYLAARLLDLLPPLPRS
jgi:hypothetical protein